MFSLDGKVAIVTGGGRGIGYSISHVLADAGADIVMCSRKLPILERAAEEIRAKGRKCLAVKTDITREEEVIQMVEKTINEFGKVDILVNNAGAVALVWKDFHRVRERVWDEEIAIFKGSLYCCKAVIPHMIERGWGRIINITTIGTKVITPGLSLYNACKTALSGFSRSIAAELGPHGITVNCVSPGAIMGQNLLEMLPEDLRVKASENPARRPGDPQDVAYTVCFLASEEARYIIGQEILVDGGRADYIAGA